MIQVGVVGDVHFDEESQGKLAPAVDELDLDLLLLAGDLTKLGTTAQGSVIADELNDISVPVVAVLGNHEFHSEEDSKIVDLLSDAGAHVLEGNHCEFQFEDLSIGIAGTVGFGGGFQGASGNDFGEPEMKAFIQRTRRMSASLQESLIALATDIKIALLHYAPVPETLDGEPLEIYPFLGSYLLAQAIDEGGADVVFHGHAHHGSHVGKTAGGVPVFNVAQPLIQKPVAIYRMSKEQISEVE